MLKRILFTLGFLAISTASVSAGSLTVKNGKRPELVNGGYLINDTLTIELPDYGVEKGYNAIGYVKLGYAPIYQGSALFAEQTAVPTELDTYGEVFVKTDKALYYQTENGSNFSVAGLKVTADPCGTLEKGSIFYNATANAPCFCGAANADLLIADGNACF